MDNSLQSKAWTFEDGAPIKSINSRFAVNLCCTNKTNAMVEALWLNFQGEEVSYGHIRPGEVQLLRTYLTHPWVFRKLDNREEVLLADGKPVVWPSQAQTFVDLEEAKLVPWNTTTHRSKFIGAKRAFARDVRNLLLVYLVQRKGHRRNCDLARRCTKTGKPQKSNTGGANRDDGSPAKFSVFFCGVKLWHWRGVQDCNALHTANSMYHFPALSSQRASEVAGATTSSSPSAPTTAADSHSHQQPELENRLLGQLPFDIILEIIAKMAPTIHDVKPVVQDDMVLMPLGLQPAQGPVALLAAMMMGPQRPPVPVADAWAWFAAANAGAFAGAPEFADIAAMLGAPNVQPAPRAAAAARLPPQVLAIMHYTEASVLMNVALPHAERMALHALAEARAIWRILEAQTAARQRQQEAQQSQAGEVQVALADGELPGGGQVENQEQMQQQLQAAHGDGADQVQAEAAEPGDATSEYGDAQEVERVEDYAQPLGQEGADQGELAYLGSEGEGDDSADEIVSQEGHGEVQREGDQGLSGEEDEVFEDAEAGEAWVAVSCGLPWE